MNFKLRFSLAVNFEPGLHSSIFEWTSMSTGILPLWALFLILIWGEGGNREKRPPLIHCSCDDFCYQNSLHAATCCMQVFQLHNIPLITQYHELKEDYYGKESYRRVYVPNRAQQKKYSQEAIEASLNKFLGKFCVCVCVCVCVWCMVRIESTCTQEWQFV